MEENVLFLRHHFQKTVVFFEHSNVSVFTVLLNEPHVDGILFFGPLVGTNIELDLEISSNHFAFALDSLISCCFQLTLSAK
jgi:hypothetical protein